MYCVEKKNAQDHDVWRDIVNAVCSTEEGRGSKEMIVHCHLFTYLFIYLFDFFYTSLVQGVHWLVVSKNWPMKLLR